MALAHKVGPVARRSPATTAASTTGEAGASTGPRAPGVRRPASEAAEAAQQRAAAAARKRAAAPALPWTRWEAPMVGTTAARTPAMARRARLRRARPREESRTAGCVGREARAPRAVKGPARDAAIKPATVTRARPTPTADRIATAASIAAPPASRAIPVRARSLALGAQRIWSDAPSNVTPFGRKTTRFGPASTVPAWSSVNPTCAAAATARSASASET